MAAGVEQTDGHAISGKVPGSSLSTQMPCDAARGDGWGALPLLYATYIAALSLFHDCYFKCGR